MIPLVLWIMILNKLNSTGWGWGCERTPTVFHLEEAIRLLPAKKPLNPGQCPKGPNLAAITTRGFFTYKQKFAPVGFEPHTCGCRQSALTNQSSTLWHDIEQEHEIVLCDFEQLSSLKINFHKGKIFALGMRKTVNNNICNYLGAK